MARRQYQKASKQIEGFAEDLGTLLGSATAKAESWLGQRQQIVKRLTEVRDTASKLLADLGHQAEAVVASARRGRPPGSTLAGGVRIVRGVAPEPVPVVRKRRKMSKKARAAISAAQKARWAKQKAADNKKK